MRSSVPHTRRLSKTLLFPLLVVILPFWIADAWSSNSNSASKLMEAIELGEEEHVRSMLEQLSPTSIEALLKSHVNGKNALHWAVLHNHCNIANIIVDHGAKVNAKDEEGYTALHYAVQGREECTRVLLAHHASPDVLAEGLRRLHDLTAVHMGAMNGTLRILEMLREAKADLHAVDSAGFSAIFYASMNREHFHNIIEFLVFHGVDVNRPCSNGFTALHFALSRCSPKVIHVLLSVGADVNAGKEDEDSALHLALSRREYALEYARLLIAAGANVSKENHFRLYV